MQLKDKLSVKEISDKKSILEKVLLIRIECE